ncbi:uncharacterized protein LOC143355045 isoform X2 [Halictus rubicundus]|uniref:uncharacterized protein LOC143355045 isoform X2 n=1 Tax=Halictus rubicundus TaxID=77578 RepID=UPI004036E15D
MKLLVVLGVLAIQCTAAKSWNSDSKWANMSGVDNRNNVSVHSSGYSEESFSLFGWINYFKRLSLIALTLSGVILYYIPESRPYARKICCTIIDITANTLKTALSACESDYMYETIKSNYHRARYEQSLNRRSQEGVENEGLKRPQACNSKRKPSMVSDGLQEIRERKKLLRKQSKDSRQSRPYLRNSVTKKDSDSHVERKPSYFYTDRVDDLPKYVKSNLRGVNRINGSVENYALLISGSPREMAMLDQKYEKGDVIFVQDPYCRIEYKECCTSTDRLSTKTEVSVSEQEGPTRDDNNYTESGMETYVKDVDLSSTPEAKAPRYYDHTTLYESNSHQCGSGCCGGGNGCSVSSAEINSKEVSNAELLDATKNVLKSSKSMINPKSHEKMEDNYTNYGRDSRILRTSNFSNDRKVNFLNEDQIITHKREEGADPRDSVSSRYVDTKKVVAHRRNDVTYVTDRGGEADDENSQLGGRTPTMYDFDERPQREKRVYKTYSDDSIFDMDEAYCTKPILKNRFKPALLRAVNWIFGGCPEASRSNMVGKEEIQEFTDEWLL